MKTITLVAARVEMILLAEQVFASILRVTESLVVYSVYYQFFYLQAGI